MTENIHSKLLILGSGPAGYTAAIYASRAMLNPVLLTGIEPGGQMTITTDVENYPGFADVVQGPWLMEQMKEQAISVGTNIIFDTIINVDLSKKPYQLISDSENIYTCDALIIATGAQAKWLGIESEDKFKGYGVSACATCDGFFYRDKKVIVVGGGNTAVEEALFLTNFANEVKLIHRRDNLRAEKILQSRLKENKKIEIIWDTELTEIIGSEDPLSVNGALLLNKKSNETKKIETDGIFIAIGHSPSSSIFKNQLNMNDNGYIDTKPDSTKTSIEGIFAAGDVTDEKYRQAVTAAGMGCMAALEAESYLAE
ncbi:MAG: thioredoxin-disulfide reductase [Pseudomonadota bacterium]|nr:thioredoxin-disulfide reductase [Pseudomonadota bacterium]MEC7735611.1 thioredoxin-disulfide reductase [Pseudomonadota bacterium]MEC9382301.1 thioredoxin-disulfide reductase [Pseudomonadota bacterium]MEC9458427.1 thioredoxin-disulfide reductase [Pseudomonadota bacterium]